MIAKFHHNIYLYNIAAVYLLFYLLCAGPGPLMSPTAPPRWKRGVLVEPHGNAAETQGAC